MFKKGYKSIPILFFLFLLSVFSFGGQNSSQFDSFRSEVKMLYGHFPYSEASTETLKAAGRYRKSKRIVQLESEAADTFRSMREEARAQDIELVPISGFRKVSYQEGLFRRAAERYGSKKAASMWVAPPGHSEHHTGYAVDIGDGHHPAWDTESRFEKSKSFKWLILHAHTYGFEMSFGPGRNEVVFYEPWHWRYVGNEKARETFEAVRKTKETKDKRNDRPE